MITFIKSKGDSYSVKLIRKSVKGHTYYYFEAYMRLDRPRVFSIYIGRKEPSKERLNSLRRELAKKIYNELLGDCTSVFLSEAQLIEAEKKRRKYDGRALLLGKPARDEKDETDAINFVYATLSTEGIPITKEDARLAYKFNEKNIRSLRDENLRVALDMIKGLREVKESKNGLSEEFILKLHNTIMAGFSGKSPGSFRKKQAYIYLKSVDRVEEIGFRPATAHKVKISLQALIEWYNENVGKLNALELAALLHLRFYSIHPFEDGNKRMARLLLNKALFDSGYPLLNISRETRSYFNALIKSVEGKTEKPFVEFVYQKFIEDT